MGEAVHQPPVDGQPFTPDELRAARRVFAGTGQVVEVLHVVLPMHRARLIEEIARAFEAEPLDSPDDAPAHAWAAMFVRALKEEAASG